MCGGIQPFYFSETFLWNASLHPDIDTNYIDNVIKIFNTLQKMDSKSKRRIDTEHLTVFITCAVGG